MNLKPLKQDSIKLRKELFDELKRLRNSKSKENIDRAKHVAQLAGRIIEVHRLEVTAERFIFEATHEDEDAI